MKGESESQLRHCDNENVQNVHRMLGHQNALRAADRFVAESAKRPTFTVGAVNVLVGGGVVKFEL
jgi:hypothetical protein